MILFRAERRCSHVGSTATGRCPDCGWAGRVVRLFGRQRSCVHPVGTLFRVAGGRLVCGRCRVSLGWGRRVPLAAAYTERLQAARGRLVP